MFQVYWGVAILILKVYMKSKVEKRTQKEGLKNKTLRKYLRFLYIHTVYKKEKEKDSGFKAV